MIKHPKYKINILESFKEIKDGITNVKKNQDATKYMMQIEKITKLYFQKQNTYSLKLKTQCTK